MERQADRLAAAILMPACAVRLIAASFDKRELFWQEGLRYSLVLGEDSSNTYDVSFEAVRMRASDLNHPCPFQCKSCQNTNRHNPESNTTHQ